MALNRNRKSVPNYFEPQWSDEVIDICWGTISGIATEVSGSRIKVTEDECPLCEDIIDYELSEIIEQKD